MRVGKINKEMRWSNVQNHFLRTKLKINIVIYVGYINITDYTNTHSRFYEDIFKLNEIMNYAFTARLTELIVFRFFFL